MQNKAIVYHGGNAYRGNYLFMSRNDAFNLIKNSSIIDQKMSIIKQKKITFSLCIV